eukprot:586796_1
MNTQIQSSQDRAINIRIKSTTDAFRLDTQNELAQYFNDTNKEIYFSVISTGDEQYKYPIHKPEDRTSLYLSIVIVSIGCLGSLAALVFNKRDGTKVDNSGG